MKFAVLFYFFFRYLTMDHQKLTKAQLIQMVKDMEVKKLKLHQDAQVSDKENTGDDDSNFESKCTEIWFGKVFEFRLYFLQRSGNVNSVMNWYQKKTMHATKIQFIMA